MLRLIITAILIGLVAWFAYQVFQRVVLAVMMVLILVLASGCKFTLPTDPPIRICAPANSVYCIPGTEWGLADYSLFN